ncbi:MAG: HAMP domain-containing histidine kinase [Nitrospinae bacterium]|nr:HAMP domain-containing histidine kinase [Nitrospinota bacterium]MBF0634278.1 HAMP domain-containing histidine kinase [Nitrospinota bacterium]
MSDVQEANVCCREMVEKTDRAISSISHDLKSPMVAIAALTKILMEEINETAPEPERIKRWMDFLSRISGAAMSSLSLVEDILTMAKIEAGKEPVEPEWTAQPGAELKDILATFGMEAEAKRISLGVEVGELPPVRWDMRRIRYHCINNVLSNALKFTPSGGAVTLRAFRNGDRVRIIVEDNGPGIPPAERERIFLRFEQSSLSSARVFSGAGLGLANAWLFVKRHGGDIFAEEANPHGARFVMELPIDALNPDSAVEC